MGTERGQLGVTPPPTISGAIHPEDVRARKRPDAYLASGQRHVRLIRLALRAAEKPEPATILDLPCGYGRVLRHLRAAFPDTTITACDIHRPAVDFCAEELGAIPVYGTEDPFDLQIGPFDLAWCGSLLTHLEEAGWDRFLSFFEAVLPPGGLFVFTTNGPNVTDGPFREGWKMYDADEQIRDTALQAYAATGFAYYEYRRVERHDRLSLPKDYGISLSAPSWVCKKLEQFKFDLLTFTSGCWGTRWGLPARGAVGGMQQQDVVGCIRRE